MTFGALLANGVEVCALAPCDGIDPELVSYPAQSGVGTEAPAQVICWGAFASPVLLMLPERSVVDGLFWNSPIPPRSTARGPRKAPAKPSTRCAVPELYEKPIRGLTNT